MRLIILLTLFFSFGAFASDQCVVVEKTIIKSELIEINCKAQVDECYATGVGRGYCPTLLVNSVYKVEQLITIRDKCEKKTLEQYKDISKEKVRSITTGEIQFDSLDEGRNVLRQAKNTCREITN